MRSVESAATEPQGREPADAGGDAIDSPVDAVARLRFVIVRRDTRPSQVRKRLAELVVATLDHDVSIVNTGPSAQSDESTPVGLRKPMLPWCTARSPYTVVISDSGRAVVRTQFEFLVLGLVVWTEWRVLGLVDLPPLVTVFGTCIDERERLV